VLSKEARQAVSLYHLSVKTVSRSTGRSAVAAAAYRSGERLTNERDGQTHDFTRRRGVVGSFIVAPAGAEGWAQDRATLWNRAEAAENRKNSTVAREYELALPAELDAADRAQLAGDFAEAVVQRFGVVADVALHAPGGEGDQRNHHAHVLTTTRAAGPDGLGAKTRVLDDQKSGAIEEIRALWADQVNQALERARSSERVDHRSYERQSKDQAPELHLGPAAMAMERREQQQAKHEERDPQPQTEIAQQNAEIKADNATRAGLRQQLVDTVREWAEVLREGWGRVQERLGVAQQAAQERQEAARAAKEAQQAAQARQEAQEAARREARLSELRGLDNGALQRAAETDRRPIENNPFREVRSVALADALGASPAYVAAADRVADLHKETAQVAKTIEHYAKLRDYSRAQGDERWRVMGRGLALAQWGHKTGLRPDAEMAEHERGEKFAVEHLVEPEKRRDELARELPAAEKAAAVALEEARPGAEATLAAWRERGEAAREVQAERSTAQKAQQEAAERAKTPQQRKAEAIREKLDREREDRKRDQGRSR
jgi:hypothetical protein